MNSCLTKGSRFQEVAGNLARLGGEPAAHRGYKPDDGIESLLAGEWLVTAGFQKSVLVKGEVEPNAAASSTRVLAEEEPNDALSDALAIERTVFTIADNPDLRDDSLPSVTVEGRISTTQDLDHFAVELKQQEFLYIDFRSGLDPSVFPTREFLTVYDSQGQVVQPYVEGETLLRFMAAEDGTYTIVFHANVNGIQPDSNGAYTAHLSLNDHADPSILGLLSGEEWDKLNLSYSFPTSPAQYEYQTPSGFLAARPEHQAMISTIMNGAGFSGLQFSKASTPGGGDLRFAFGDTDFAAYAYYPGDGSGGDSWYHQGNFNNDVLVGSDGHYIFLHEIGHALGLKHGHEEPSLLPEHNSHEFSVMTYHSWVGKPEQGIHVGSGDEEAGGKPQTFMMYDIAALQYLYGANFSFNSGSTIYRWDPNTGESFINGVGQGVPGYTDNYPVNRILRTVWDGGGEDSYDLSNYNNDVKIDLRPGEWTITSPDQLVHLNYAVSDVPPVFARGNIANALLYRGDLRSLIENATGGAGNDTIVGNQKANRLTGNGGNDRLDGREGADVLAGGSGNDIYMVDNSADSVVEAAGGGTDTVESAVGYMLAANVEKLTLTGAAAVNATGNSLANSLTGNSATNILDGGAGADIMAGGGGNDIYVVDNAADKAVEASAGDGIDTVRSSVGFTLGNHVENLVLTGAAAVSATGNALANSLTGNAAANSLSGGGGNDLIDGRAGADSMSGGYGNDVYVVDHAADRIVELSGAGADAVRSSVGLTLADHVEKLVLTGTSAIAGTGNRLANELYGNAAGNALAGGGGHDLIDGGLGNDRLNGGTGSDQLRGGAGADHFLFDAPLGAANVDKILDFAAPSDSLYLHRSIFAAAGANGTLASSGFRKGSAAADSTDRIVYDQAAGKIFYDADGSGGGAAILFATVTPGAAMSYADFVIYG